MVSARFYFNCICVKTGEKKSVIGGMAGSSMDGLDLVHCDFWESDGKWHFKLNGGKTYPYPRVLKEKLENAPTQSLANQKALDVSFGEWVGKTILDFIKKTTKPDLLGVHGHTLIHNPEKGISWQLGDGSTIAHITQIPTAVAFRSQDISLGGQGAPLVPFGDFDLFGSYDSCLNLGGIANISIKSKKMAWDICPCNQVLNFYAKKLGKSFDNKGAFAASGHFDDHFYNEIKAIPFFEKLPPKSLPNQFIATSILNTVPPLDGLHTYTHFIVGQVAEALKNEPSGSLLITGGGAHNTYLISLIRKSIPGWNIIVPEVEIIDYKEALIFAFLGLMKSLDKVNVFSSVTGATNDSASGVIHFP